MVPMLLLIDLGSTACAALPFPTGTSDPQKSALHFFTKCTLLQ